MYCTTIQTGVKKNFDNHQALDNGPRLSQNPHVGAEVRPKEPAEMLAFFVHGGNGGYAVALNRRQALFVAEYLKDLNASAAARRAGYSEKSAFRSGVQNMQKSAITDAIAAAMKERADRVQITADKVLADIELIKTDAMREAADKEGKRAMVNHAAALKACELQGRHLQMFVDRVAMTIEQVPDEELDGRIAELARKAGAARATD
jgi:phage terminase small subunit